MKPIFGLMCLMIGYLCSCTPNTSKKNPEKDNRNVYLMSYFKGNGDGLHLAYSRDGLQWEALCKDAVSFPKGIRHGTTFTVSEPILEGLQ